MLKLLIEIWIFWCVRLLIILVVVLGLKVSVVLVILRCSCLGVVLDFLSSMVMVWVKFSDFRL